MEIIKVKTRKELSNLSADIFEKQIKKKPDTIIGLPTGSTPLDTYEELSIRNKAGKIDFNKVISFNLDEYVGLDKDNEQSYAYFMNKNLFSKINIKNENTHIPNGVANDLLAECENYDKMIKESGGIDLQLLGIGVDGHIGFNEPCDKFLAGTHVVTLDPSTIDANSRFFISRDDVPRKALTMGVKTIMEAKQILMIVTGSEKKDIFEKAIYGEIDPNVQASIIQLHPNVTVIYSEE